METHKNWFDNQDYELFSFIYTKSLKLLRDKQIQLLDVGCGKGDFLKYIRAKNPAARLFGIDLISNQYPGIHFIKGNFLEKKIKIKFNIISSFAVIEHVDNPHLFVRKLKDLLEPEGFLFIMTINSNSLMYSISRLLNKAGIHTAYDRLYSLHHIQHYTNKSLKTLMERDGLDVLLQKNHNRPMKAVDVPGNNFLIEKIYKFLVWTIFLLSNLFRCGMDQTIVCKKSSS
jgi:SAM-dependent methyltransferase